MFVSIWRKVLRNKHHQFIPLWKKYFVWAPSSSVSAIWQFLPAAGASGNSDHLLKNVPWLCKGKYSTLASSALARLSSRHLLARAPGSFLRPLLLASSGYRLRSGWIIISKVQQSAAVLVEFFTRARVLHPPCPFRLGISRGKLSLNEITH